MRMNTPVTNVEQILRDGESIVSTTDLQGNITYANPYFIEVSGYSEGELIGAPQNILRHPDMPKEAFFDLWATIKSGLPWTGMVKNRTKSGDYYWVMANVTPVIENGKPIGYMSVRTKPSREQVNEASQLYQKMREGSLPHVALKQGTIINTSIWGKLAAITQVSITQRIHLCLGAGTLLTLGLAIDDFMHQSVQLGFVELFTSFILFYLWYFLISALTTPLNEAIKAVQSISGGDLTTRIQTQRKDEIGQLLRAIRQLNVNLHSIIGDVRKNFGEISVATKEIASGNMDLSGRTESQASALEETASSMEELASAVEQNTANAMQANKLADDASRVAEQGGTIFHDVVQTIGEISTSSRKIVDIISIIDSIAFQTNILALNAAVEAARAGEQGRGFAVVAAEVRNLAQRSSSAAKDIKQLIEVSVSKVDAGTKLAERAGTTMDNIIRSVHHVTGIMSEIAAASREQSDGITQVNNAVTQMDEVTQQNAALVEEAAAAAGSLEEQTYRLSKAMEIFKLSEVHANFSPTSVPKRASPSVMKHRSQRPQHNLLRG